MNRLHYCYIYAISNPHPPLSPHTPKTEQELQSLSMAAENSILCLIGGMDSLWFHQTILFPQPPLLRPVSSSEYSSKIGVKTEHSSQESDDLEKNRVKTEHDHPQSPSPISTRKKSRLWKSMSCKTLMELELEEVRGFIDLGFNFRRENLSNHIINLIPGLQRIEDKFDGINDDDDEDKDVMWPYLSESWIIRRPDSPLLNLRMPTLCCAEDMKKKHLKFWAQTVASAVQE